MALVARLRNDNKRQYLVMPLVPDVVDDVRDVMTARVDSLLGEDLEVIDYEPGYILEEGQVFRLEDQQIADHIYDAFRNTAVLDRLEGNDIQAQGVGGVFGQWEIGNRVVTVGQSLSSAYALQRPSGLSLLCHDGNNFIRLTGQGVTLRRATDIAIVGHEIRFLTYQTATRLLDLTEHFEAATNEVLEHFASFDALLVEDLPAFTNNADTWVRRKVALIVRRQVLSRASMEAIQEAAECERLEVDFRTNDGTTRIVLPSDKTRLKNLLRFLDEDLFYGALTGDSFITSSKRRRP
jgi:hypothetical protein